MLHFRDYACTVRRAGFGSGVGPIWMSDLRCRGTENKLEDCPFEGWGVTTCSHREDAGLICQDGVLNTVHTLLECT